MKKYYLQAYLHLKTILKREIYGSEGHFFNDYIFVQSAIKNVIKFESDSFALISLNSGAIHPVVLSSSMHSVVS